jgi:hypothetical protein
LGKKKQHQRREEPVNPERGAAPADRPDESPPVDVAEGSAGDPEPVVFHYVAADFGQYIVGIPARDLTLTDYDALEDGARAALHLNVESQQAIYTAGGDITELRGQHEERRARAAELHNEQREAVMKDMQADPNVPGRTNADVLGSGLNVPQTDEPQTQHAPGFQPADTGTTTPTEEG